jgi:hypothetical protein
MAQVTVFIDDVVLGRLPSVCVKEGVPTADRLRVRDATGGSGLGFAWLLVVLGPIGWVGMFIIAAIGRSGVRNVTGRLPFCEFAYRRLVVLQRMQTVWTVVSVILVVLAVTGIAIHSAASEAAAVALGAAALAAIVKTGLETRQLRRAEVRLQLDGSGRWVTLHGVHPDFVTAMADFPTTAVDAPTRP